MNDQFTKPKGFGEILDHTFQLVKNRFSDFFMILLILVGPMILLTAFVQLLTGTSFFREFSGDGTWLQQLATTFDQQANEDVFSSNPGADFVLTLIGIVTLAATAVAEGAIILAIYHMKNEESYTAVSVIKEAFSRFWAIIGSNILFALITIGLIIIPLIIITLVAVLGGIGGLIFAFCLLLGAGAGLGYLLVRWSFFIGYVVIDKESIGLTRSWEATRKRAWTFFGLYIIFMLITGAITLAVEATFTLLLGNSVLLSIISNLCTLFTTMIFTVGLAVMFFDIKAREGADDLQNIIDNYDK
ncbi:hypothetical protein [Radiobacillus sp. PE A8.2]|uniref:hypothetical protein n=1 Tax=Radiobacillus sp. PE A8.2 TaxID=3380349 RepID=UPI003890C6C8